MAETSTCAVCLEMNYPPFSLVPCGHAFCGNCCISMGFMPAQYNRYRSDKRCPECRAALVGPAIPNIPLRQLLEADVGRRGEREERQRAFRQRGSEGGPNSDYNNRPGAGQGGGQGMGQGAPPPPVYAPAMTLSAIWRNNEVFIQKVIMGIVAAFVFYTLFFGDDSPSGGYMYNSDRGGYDDGRGGFDDGRGGYGNDDVRGGYHEEFRRGYDDGRRDYNYDDGDY